MTGVVTAVAVGSLAIGAYSASKSASAAKSAAGTAASAEERIAAQNQALNEQRYGEAQGLLNPYIDASEVARKQLEMELGLGEIWNMPGQGEFRHYDEDQYVPGRDDMGAPGTTGQTYDGVYSVDGGAYRSGTPSPGGSPYLGAPGQISTDVAGGVMDTMRQLAPGRSYGTTASADQAMGIPEAGMNQYSQGFYSDGSPIGALQNQQAGPQAAGGSLYLDPVTGEQLRGDLTALAPNQQLYRDPVTGESVAADLSALAPDQSLYRDPQEMIDTGQYFSDLTSGWEAFTANPIYQSMIDAGAETAMSSAAASGMGQSGLALKELRNVGQGVTADFFNTYMGTMGDLTGMNEARRMADMQAEEQRYANYLNIGEARGLEQRGADEQRYANYLNIGEQRNRDVQGINEQRYANLQNITEAQRAEAASYNQQNLVNTQNINEQRYANYMNIDEQRMYNEQNTQESRYVNYMNMLQNMANPGTATNLASLGVNQGIAQAGQASQSVANINQYNLGATAAANAARSDIAGGAMNLASAYIGSQGNPAQSTPYMPQTTGTIYGGANAPRPTSYAGYA